MMSTWFSGSASVPGVPGAAGQESKDSAAGQAQQLKLTKSRNSVRSGMMGKKVAIGSLMRKQKSRSRKGAGPLARAGASLDETYQLASKAWSMAKGIGAFLNVEEKLFDVAASTTSSTTPSTVYLSDVTQGVGFNQRTGNSLKVVKWIFRYRLRVNNSASATSVRILIVRGRQRETSNPATGDVLENVSTIPLALISPYEHAFEERWSVLYDQFHPLVIGDTTASSQVEVTFERPFHVEYQNGTGGVANAAEGQLFLLHFSDEGTNTPALDYYSRLVFVDN